LGQAIGAAIASFEQNLKVLIVGTGGLSHQLDGTRAGFINKEFDLFCMDKIISDPEALTHLSNRQIIERAGSQGVELMTWIAMRGALAGPITTITSTYHVPISNTGGAVMLLEQGQQPHQSAAA
jgi:protocatechuate 4,5-dioxygenase beta chain